MKKVDKGFKLNIFAKIKELFKINKDKTQYLTFNKRRSKTKALPPANKTSEKLDIYSSMPIAEVEDKILWEIQTWDKSNVKNKVYTYYLYLPKNGTPEQFLSKNPDNFTQIFNNLKESMKPGNVNFLGEVKYDFNNDSWSACLEESKEMQHILDTTISLIGQKIEIDRISREMDAKLKNRNGKIKESNNVGQKPKQQINLNNIGNNSNVHSKSEFANQNATARQEQPSNESHNKKETIVISDLHGRLNSWEKVKKQIESNPNLNVIVLGDAMDRGDYGIEILMQIKELSDVGRVKYVPGNHDEFAYNYLKAMLDGFGANDPIYKSAYISLKNNGGNKTMEKIARFNTTVSEALRGHIITKPINIKELTDWLGNQPLQTVQTGAKNIKYALAHAIFDLSLYKYDSNFNLKKAYDLQREGKNLKNSEVLKHFKNVLWYRAGNKETHFAPVVFPKGYPMIVGHTPQRQGANMKYLDNNFSQPAIFIDGGLINKLGGFSLNGYIIDNIENRLEKQGTENSR